MNRFGIISIVVGLTLIVGCKENDKASPTTARLRPPTPIIEITNPTITQDEAVLPIKISISGARDYLDENAKYKMRFHYCLSSDSYTLDDLDWFGGGGAVGCKLESGTLSCGEEIRTFNRPGYEPEINPDVTKYLVALITILDADENIVFRTWGMSEINWKTE